MEQARIQTRLLNLGVDIVTTHSLVGAGSDGVEVACVYTDRRRRLTCDALAMVTARVSEESLFLALRGEEGSNPGLETLRCIGDCLVPSTIAQAIWDGHRSARELQSSEPTGDEAVIKQEYVRLESRR
jgi:dimethylamine/trimethylamine dehydrogenase